MAIVVVVKERGFFPTREYGGDRAWLQGARQPHRLVKAIPWQADQAERRLTGDELLGGVCRDEYWTSLGESSCADSCSPAGLSRAGLHCRRQV